MRASSSRWKMKRSVHAEGEGWSSSEKTLLCILAQTSYGAISKLLHLGTALLHLSPSCLIFPELHLLLSTSGPCTS